MVPLGGRQGQAWGSPGGAVVNGVISPDGRVTVRAMTPHGTMWPYGNAATWKGHNMARLRVARAVSDWAENLPPSFTACRDMGHNWLPFTASWDSQGRHYVRTLVCSRCTAERSQHISQTGHIISGNSYRYPDGYQAPAGMGHIDGPAKDELRLLSTLRMVDEASPKAKGA